MYVTFFTTTLSELFKFAYVAYIEILVLLSWISHPWILHYESCSYSNCQKNLFLLTNSHAKAAGGHLSFERGYNQRCHWYQNIPRNIPESHAKFHQNWWFSFWVIRGQSNTQCAILIRILYFAFPSIYVSKLIQFNFRRISFENEAFHWWRSQKISS